MSALLPFAKALRAISQAASETPTPVREGPPHELAQWIFGRAASILEEEAKAQATGQIGVMWSPPPEKPRGR